MRHCPGPLVVALTIGAVAYLGSFTMVVEGQGGAPEAPAGFDNLTNGFVPQADFDATMEAFEERDVIADGLGPVYNAQSCAECHQNPVTGGISQISELRAGHKDRNGNFVDAPGGSLINDRAINAALQERVPGNEDVRTFRMSTNVLGNGFIEAISSNTLVNLANDQNKRSNGQISGHVIQVPLSEAPGQTRVGRFGWKNQQASLLSFSGDAYLNEMGITNRLQTVENTSLGRAITAFDAIVEGPTTPFEAVANDIDEFTEFMRATKAPPRDAALANTFDARQGAQLFDQIGCDMCHTDTLVTAPVGTSINGGDFIVPAALGNKTVHPFSDFLLHD